MFHPIKKSIFASIIRLPKDTEIVRLVTTIFNIDKINTLYRTSLLVNGIKNQLSISCILV